MAGISTRGLARFKLVCSVSPQSSPRRSFLSAYPSISSWVIFFVNAPSVGIQEFSLLIQKTRHVGAYFVDPFVIHWPAAYLRVPCTLCLPAMVPIAIPYLLCSSFRSNSDIGVPCGKSCTTKQ